MRQILLAVVVVGTIALCSVGLALAVAGGN